MEALQSYARTRFEYIRANTFFHLLIVAIVDSCILRLFLGYQGFELVPALALWAINFGFFRLVFWSMEAEYHKQRVDGKRLEAEIKAEVMACLDLRAKVYRDLDAFRIDWQQQSGQVDAAAPPREARRPGVECTNKGGQSNPATTNFIDIHSSLPSTTSADHQSRSTRVSPPVVKLKADNKVPTSTAGQQIQKTDTSGEDIEALHHRDLLFFAKDYSPADPAKGIRGLKKGEIVVCHDIHHPKYHQWVKVTSLHRLDYGYVPTAYLEAYTPPKNTFFEFVNGLGGLNDAQRLEFDGFMKQYHQAYSQVEVMETIKVVLKEGVKGDGKEKDWEYVAALPEFWEHYQIEYYVEGVDGEHIKLGKVTGDGMVEVGMGGVIA